MEHRGYERIKQIGKGAFGAAVLCRSRKDTQLYVAKEVNLASMRPAEKQEAKNEIKVLAKLDHPNITKFADAFEMNQILYIVMEYADGGDLWARIQLQGPNLMSEELCMHYFVQLCLALHHMHSQKILHRDLKAANVFLTSTNMVKLGDFGISTILKHTMSMAHTKCGTPYYFSPEICQNKPYNYKSDVWSLGCILYELAGLKHAFNGNSMNELLQNITSGNYDPLSSSYSANLRGCVAAMLTLDPNRRPTVGNILNLDFVQGTIKRIVDTGAADLRGQADTRTAAANRSRYFKEAERLLAKGPAEDPEVQEAKAQLRQQAHERQRVEERREEQEAIERVKRQVQHLKEVQNQMDRDDRLRDQKGKGKGKGKADPKGKGPMQRPETPDEAPSGPVTVSGLPPAASRAVKAVIGERIMDLMVKQKKMQDALDRGLDPEALEQEEEERKREAEAKARVEKRMKENEAKDKANKEKGRLMRLLEKRKTRLKAAQLLADRGIAPEVAPEENIEGLQAQLNALKHVQKAQAKQANDWTKRQLQGLAPKPELPRPEPEGQQLAHMDQEERARFQAVLDKERARLAELEGKLALEQRERDELKQQEERLKKEWRKRGWNIAILEEQFQQRQLEFIRAKHQDRQKALEAAARRGSTPTPGPSGHPGPSSSGLPGPLPPYLENRSALGPVKAPEPEEEGQDEEAPPEAAGYGPDAYIYDRYGQLVHAPEGGPEPVPPAGAGAPAGAAPAPPPFEFLEDDVPWEPDSFKDPPPPLIPDGEEGDEDDEGITPETESHEDHDDWAETAQSLWDEGPGAEPDWDRPPRADRSVSGWDDWDEGETLSPRKSNAVGRREQESRERLLKLERREFQMLAVQSRKLLGEARDKGISMAIAQESRWRQARTMMNRQVRAQVDAERRMEREEERRQRMEEAQAQRERERLAERELKKQRDLIHELERERAQRKWATRRRATEPAAAGDAKADEEAQGGGGDEGHVPRPPPPKRVAFSKVVSWLEEEIAMESVKEDEGAGTEGAGLEGDDGSPAQGSPGALLRKKRTSVTQHILEVMPGDEDPEAEEPDPVAARFFANAPPFGPCPAASGDLTGLITVISAKKPDAPAAGPAAPSSVPHRPPSREADDLNRVHRPSAEKRRARRAPAPGFALDLDDTQTLMKLADPDRPLDAADEEDIGAAMFSHLNAAYGLSTSPVVHGMVCREIARQKDRKLKPVLSKLAKAKADDKEFTNELLMFSVQSDSAEGFKVLKAIKFVYQGLKAAADPAE